MGKSQGELAEIKFLLRASEQGYPVSKPFGDNQKYDFILDNGNTLLKIQVKSTRQKLDSALSIKIGVGYGRSSKKVYTENEVDFFALYLQCIDCFYIIPTKIIAGRVSIRIHPHRKTCTWLRYRENWQGVRKHG